MSATFVDVKVFWKGLGMPFPVNTMYQYRKLKDKCMWKSATKEEIGKDLDRLKSQLDEIENAMFQYQQDSGAFGRRIEFNQILRKLHKRLPHYETPQQISSIWWQNVFNLIEMGFIQDDDQNGILIMQTPIPFQMPFSQKICVVCGVNSKHKCPKCYTFYCCRDHQVQDWKKHKKTCCKM